MPVVSRTFKEYYLSLPTRDAGNDAMEKFSEALGITEGPRDACRFSKITYLSDDVDAIYFVATVDKRIDACTAL